MFLLEHLATQAHLITEYHLCQLKIKNTYLVHGSRYGLLIYVCYLTKTHRVVNSEEKDIYDFSWKRKDRQ